MPTRDVSHTDQITGLKNRKALEASLSMPLLSTLIIMEINDFDRLDALYGLSVVNDLLIQFSALLEATSEGRFDAYRVGGSKFVLLLQEEFLDTDELEELVPEFLRDIAENPAYLSEVEVTQDIEVVIGIASGERDLYTHANMALINAKQEKKHYLFYTVDMDMSEKHRDVLKTKKAIKRALFEKAFVPVYQPIVDRDAKVMKYECLMRMRQDDGSGEKLVTPYHFLELASETKQYSRISETVITQSIAYFQDKKVDFSINITFIDMQNRDFMKRLKQLIRSSKIGPRMIVEIVESESISDYGLLKKTLDDLKALGVRIAIDDFGTGYSNFTHILEVDPDYLKIDGSLIKDMLEDRKMRILVEAIIGFAKKLGIGLIAEFVHSKELYDVLVDLGIDEFQGFYFSEPLPVIAQS